MRHRRSRFLHNRPWKTALYAFRMHFVCICAPHSRMPYKSRAERTFSRFVCSVCSRFRSWPFFWHFPFIGTAYNAYNCIQMPLKPCLSPTAEWAFAACSCLARKLHTENAYKGAKTMPAKRKNSGLGMAAWPVVGRGARRRVRTHRNRQSKRKEEPVELSIRTRTIPDMGTGRTLPHGGRSRLLESEGTA